MEREHLAELLSWPERLERMAAVALKFGSVEGAAQVRALIPHDDLAERVDGINQVYFQDELPFDGPDDL